MNGVVVDCFKGGGGIQCIKLIRKYGFAPTTLKWAEIEMKKKRMVYVQILAQGDEKDQDYLIGEKVDRMGRSSGRKGEGKMTRSSLRVACPHSFSRKISEGLIP